MSALLRTRLAAAAGLACILMAAAAPARAAGPQAGWAAAKCDRYRQAFDDAVRRWGTEGLGADFLDGHRRFVAGGCRGPADICPRPGRETELANILTVRAMNAGMASTFLPWTCR